MEMIRPDWAEFSRNITGYIYCGCGTTLQNIKETRRHWQMGHFDFSENEKMHNETAKQLSGGLNKDDGKLRVDLVPVEAIYAIAEVLGNACRSGLNGEPPKYPENNWRKGIKYSRIYANILRHLYAWKKGKDIDPESGLHALKHAICRLAMLVTYIENDMKELDDRFDK